MRSSIVFQAFLLLSLTGVFINCQSKSENEFKITDDSPKVRKQARANPKLMGPSVQLQNCTRLEFAIDCSSKGFFSLPSQVKDFKTVNFRNNSIRAVNLTQLPLDTIKVLDLSYNQIKSIVGPKEAASGLEMLYLRGNNLTSFNSSKLINLRSMDLSENRLVVLNSSSFASLNKLEVLNLSKNNLTKLNDQLFTPLRELELLNISSAGISLTISDKLFVNNTDLRTLDMSYLNLTEIPAATRLISKLKVLYFKGNLMSSLRESDLLCARNLQVLYIQESPILTQVDEFAFKHLKNLDELVLSRNPKLQYLSKDIFEPNGNTTLSKLDLSYNNLTTLGNIFDDSGLSVAKLILDGNNWFCDCDLKWLSFIPIENRSLVYCKNPEHLRDLDLTYLRSIDCEPTDDSSYRAIVTIISLILILAAIIGILAQRVQFVSKLFRRDQHGSIYYSKASFPLEPT